MNRLTRIKGVVRGNLAALRVTFIVFLFFHLVDVVIDFSLLFAGLLDQGWEVSGINIFTIFLVVMAIMVPKYFFKRIVALGASRKEYYIGSVISYGIAIAFFAVLNILWFFLEKNFLNQYRINYNVIQILGWDRYGIVGMFFYQFAGYTLLISVVHLIASSVKQWLGNILILLIIVASALVMAVTPLKNTAMACLETLIMNPNIFVVCILTLLLSSLIFVF